MKRKLLIPLLTIALLCALTACGAPQTDGGAESDSGASGSQTRGKASAENAAQSLPAASGLSMRVDADTGELSIDRAYFTDGEADEDGVWTIFVYLCGTDLESSAMMGTQDVNEMRAAATGDNMRFIVQTGGTRRWNNGLVNSGKTERYLVQNGEMTRIDELAAANMGKPETLYGFLQWGLEEYASEHMGLILWNHGGGSITGVCFDEVKHYDSLDLKELDTALYAACEESGRRFDFIGFDACLMGTVETASVLASYADYMYGSEETEIGSGWDYAAIGDYLGANPDADAASLGKAVCDSFYKSCRAAGDEELVTLSVIDLNRLDDFLIAFNRFAKSMYDAGEKGYVKTQMLRAMGRADNFGGNNKSEGYTNMVDLGGIISACAPYAQGTEETLQALNDTVVYSVRGSAHKDASGLSTYYPLSVQGSKELRIFGGVCVSPYYLAFVDRQNQSGVIKEDASDYDGGQWFNDSGAWTWGESGDDDYWDYIDDYEQTGESPYITFDVEPELDENGNYWFSLDDDGWEATLDVYGVVYQISPDGEDFIELGETYDIDGDWEYGIFADDFDGFWFSLPDGQNLATHIVEDGDGYEIYTSPIRLNGEDTNLRLKLDYSGDEMTMTIEGAWDGINEQGAASRNVTKLKDGDVIVPLYKAYAIEDDREITYVGEEYVISGEPEFDYDFLDDGEYLYSFCIEDIYGDYYLTDSVSFTVEDGEVWFDAE